MLVERVDKMSNVLKYYEYLHTIPECGFEEVKTSKFLADNLEKFGYEVERSVGGKTGIVGVYDSQKPGPTVAIRADMDALGHIVDGKPCAIHSCGHDGHSSVVLTVAEIIKTEKLVKRGKIKIIFQPAEELATGAKTIIQGGAIEDVDYIFGSHVRPIEEASLGEAAPAIYYSSSCHVTAHIHGKPAHGARPHLGVNAINAAVAAISSVNAIHLKPTDVYSVKATRFHADAGAVNAIPAEAEVVWDLRAQKNDTMEELQKKVKMAIEGAVMSIGATVDLDIPDGLPAAEYDDECIDLLKEAIRSVLGEKGLITPIVTPGGEDFFYYKRHKPSIKAGFFGLGCDLKPGLHHPAMSFNKDALENSVKIFLFVIKKLLG